MSMTPEEEGVLAALRHKPRHSGDHEQYQRDLLAAFSVPIQNAAHNQSVEFFVELGRILTPPKSKVDELHG